jgi:hypothetical protein
MRNVVWTGRDLSIRSNKWIFLDTVVLYAPIYSDNDLIFGRDDAGLTGTISPKQQILL